MRLLSPGLEKYIEDHCSDEDSVSAGLNRFTHLHVLMPLRVPHGFDDVAYKFFINFLMKIVIILGHHFQKIYLYLAEFIFFFIHSKLF
jgi:hypothetical protein